MNLLNILWNKAKLTLKERLYNGIYYHRHIEVTSIRQDLKRKTMIEFIQNGEVIQGTFKLDKKNDMR